MSRQPTCTTRTDTLFPYTTLYRSARTTASPAGRRAQCASGARGTGRRAGTAAPAASARRERGSSRRSAIGHGIGMQQVVQIAQHAGGGAPDVIVVVGHRPPLALDAVEYALVLLVVAAVHQEGEGHFKDLGDLMQIGRAHV